MPGIRPSLVRYAWLSIGAALVTIALKTGAYWLTDSVGLLSDALESLVNLVAAIVALAALTVAARPADEDHAFGHDKAEYFSSGLEGGLILLAAFAIAVTALDRLLHPRPLVHVGLGLGVSLIASLINLGTALVLFAAGRRHHSITLEADAHHLMTDVWTSVGVLVGVGAVRLTGWGWLDPAVALAVAANIVRMGIRLVRRSFRGLMDVALPAEERAVIKEVLDRYRREGVDYHAFRTRRAAARRFVSVHVLVPGAWTVQQGHDLLERIEADVCALLPHTTISTHLEPREDPASWHDVGLDRATAPRSAQPKDRQRESPPRQGHGTD
ncbi:MAG: cation diffusion facilitator family transporter [Nitrospirota bacterium]|jgi:cation diffusion facilitator family transporter